MPASRTLPVISLNVPQSIKQIRDEDRGRLVELNLTSCMDLICG